jgi:hypothetical protein
VDCCYDRFLEPRNSAIELECRGETVRGIEEVSQVIARAKVAAATSYQQSAISDQRSAISDQRSGRLVHPSLTKHAQARPSAIDTSPCCEHSSYQPI